LDAISAGFFQARPNNTRGPSDTTFFPLTSPFLGPALLSRIEMFFRIPFPLTAAFVGSLLAALKILAFYPAYPPREAHLSSTTSFFFFLID